MLAVGHSPTQRLERQVLKYSKWKVSGTVYWTWDLCPFFPCCVDLTNTWNRLCSTLGSFLAGSVFFRLGEFILRAIYKGSRAAVTAHRVPAIGPCWLLVTGLTHVHVLFRRLVMPITVPVSKGVISGMYQAVFALGPWSNIDKIVGGGCAQTSYSVLGHTWRFLLLEH